MWISANFTTCSLRDYHRLGYHKFCAKWVVPKNLTGAHKTQGLAWDLTVLERYQKDGDEFLSQIVRVTGVETWISFLKVETKVVDAHTFSKQAEKFKQYLPTRKLTVAVFWYRKGVLMLNFM
jgi:hypothetical protein